MSRRGTRLPDAPPDNNDDGQHLTESEPDDSEEEGEDIVGEDMDKDYTSKPKLDTYDESQFDETLYPPMRQEDRLAAEREMNRRQRERRMRGPIRRGIPAFLAEDSEPPSLDNAELFSGSLASEGARGALGSQMPSSLEAEEAETATGISARGEEVEERFDLDTIENPTEAFQQPAPKREMARLFRDFLLQFIPEEQKEEYKKKVEAAGSEEGIEEPTPFYPEVLQECKRNNRHSFEVDYRHIIQHNSTMASFLIYIPSLILPIFDEVAMQLMIGQDDFYPRVTSTINVRISNIYPELPLTRLRQTHLNTLICTSGVVTRRSAVFSQTTEARFNCETCGTVIGPFTVTQKDPIKIKRCPNCDSRGPFRLNNEETVFRNYQRVTLQEAPNALEPGRLPRHKELILVNDLIDSCKPGEEIEVTGIYVNQYDVVLNKQYGFPVFTTQIDVNNIKIRSGRESESGSGGADMTVEEKNEVEELAKQPDIADRVFRSFAPAIYGHEDIKRALCLAMVGGVRIEIPGHIVRGDINVLVLGDPATAKSQLMKYVEQTADRVVRTTGRGASAVGLTAAVRRDPTTGEWTLEGGAMVLANNGICVIDEFDKMNDKDRTSIHEAMEQQTISISKAGIVAVLNARCAVIAAANPIHSRYDVTQTFLQNVDLSEPILSRFDILCVVKDTIDDENDRRMARFIMKSHIMAHPEFKESDLSSIPQLSDESLDPSASSDERLMKTLVSSGDGTSDFTPLTPTQLRNYIHYARTFSVNMNNLPSAKIEQLYTDLRQAARNCGGTPVSPRYVDSILRVSQAYAKLRLHPVVTEDDVQMAIRTVLESFIMSQKYQAKAALRKQFQAYMIYNKDKFVLLRELLKRMESEVQQYAMFRIEQRMQAAGIEDPEDRQEYIRKELELMGGSVTVVIEPERFMERAKSESIEESTVNAFLRSETFRRTGFKLELTEKHTQILRKTGVNLMAA